MYDALKHHELRSNAAGISISVNVHNAHEKQEKPGTKTILGPGNYATMSKKEHTAKRNP